MEKLLYTYKRNKKKLLTLLTIICVLTSLYNFYVAFYINVRSNDECVWLSKIGKNGDTTLVFTLVKENGVTWEAGIRNGDILLGINGKKVPNAHVATVIIERLESGDYALYEVKKPDGSIIETKVRIKKLIFFGPLGFSLLGFIWILIAFITIMSKPDGYVQRLFYLIGVLYIFFVSGNSLNGFEKLPFGHSLTAFIIIDLTWSLAFSYLPFVSIYFFWIFPKPFKFAVNKAFKIIYFSIPPVLYAISVIMRINGYVNEIDMNVYFILTQIFNGALISSLFVQWIFLAINYFRLKPGEERKPYRFILIAFSFGMASLIYTLTLASVIAESIFNQPELFAPIVLIAVIPIAFAHSIFKYQLMDVSLVVKNAIIYGAATATLAGVYFMIMYLLGQEISSAIGTEYKGIIAGLVFVAFAIIFQSTKDKFQDVLTRKFYPEEFTCQIALQKFGKELPFIVGLDNIYNSIENVFVQSLKLKQFGLFIRKEKENCYNIARYFGLSPEELTIEIKDDEGERFVNSRLKYSMHLFLERDEFRFLAGEDSEKLIRAGIYSILPLIAKSRIIGFIALGLKHSGFEFAGKDIELLTSAASHSAVAIENARLYESEAVKIVLENDLENARKIQNSLLPKETPNIKGLEVAGRMIPAMQVGGDYFDLIKVSEAELFVAVGDVSGKGLPASLYMAKLQTIIRYLCAPGKSPKEIAVEANSIIGTALEKNWFITLSLGLFNIKEKKVRFVRAGHSPLLLMNSKSEFLQPKGLGLGLEDGEFFGSSLEESIIGFNDGQIFAFYSDGFSEAMNKEKQLYGDEELARILKNSKEKRAEEILEDAFNSVAQFRNGAEQNDDMTLVLVKT